VPGELWTLRRAGAVACWGGGNLNGVSTLRPRTCARPTCSGRATATLTFVYSDQMVVLGPLALHDEPSGYDLCARHTESFTPPRGWEVIRLAPEAMPLGPSREDLEILADSVRERGRRPAANAPMPTLPGPRHGHLRVLAGGRHGE
jgi:hypothetical protein